VFGVFELVVFLTSPIFGHLLPRLGVTQAFTFGIGATGCMCITFGCLNFIQVGISLKGIVLFFLEPCSLPVVVDGQ
jgi:hypothetical protein